jgi:hypothetical protein
VIRFAKQHREDLMKFRHTVGVRQHLVVIIAVLALCAAATTALAQEKTTADTVPTVYREAVTIELSGKAQANGTFTMIFRPFQEDGTKVTVNVAKGMKAKKIAADLAKELGIAAGSRYKVKHNDKKVKIRQASRKTSPTLAVEIEEQKLNGVAIMIGK